MPMYALVGSLMFCNLYLICRGFTGLQSHSCTHNCVYCEGSRWFNGKPTTKASAVPSLQRLLNKDDQKKRLTLKRMFNEIKSNQETKKKKVDINNPNFRVNYVCNVDVIT